MCVYNVCTLKLRQKQIVKAPPSDGPEWDDEPEDTDVAPYLQSFDDFDWLPELEDKIWKKHSLRPEDVEQCFWEPDPKGRLRAIEDDKYLLYCHATSGMYLFIVFAYKTVWNWRFVRIISA